MSATAAGRLRGHLAQPLFAGAYGLMASTVVTTVLGIGFWAVAARSSTPAEVGRDAVLITSMMTLSNVCQLNLFDGLVRFLPTVRPARRVRAVIGAYAAAGAAGLVGGALFVLGAPALSSELDYLGSDAWLGVGFALATAGWSIFVLQDAALTAVRRTWWLPVENAGFSILKMLLLPVAALAGLAHGIFAAWVVPLVVLLPVVNVLLVRRVLRPEAVLGAPPAAASRPQGRNLVGFLLEDYAGYVLGQAAVTVIPLVVLTQLGSTQSGWFAIPFTLVVALDLLFYAVTTSMTVEGAHDHTQVRALLRTVARRFLVLLVPIALLVVAAAPLLLAPFGSDYADEGTTALRLLACASVPHALVTLYTAVSRLRGRGRPILAAQATLFALVVGLALALAEPHGLPGVALAWLAGNVVVGLAVALPLVRAARAEPAA
ncbi:MAG TPA: hypothetical protein VD931_14105 [Baekduia sp.]|nr:hypothetical protein [Baekduia sp.]